MSFGSISGIIGIYVLTFNSGIYPDIFSGILSDILFDIPCGIYCHIYSILTFSLAFILASFWHSIWRSLRAFYLASILIFSLTWALRSGARSCHPRHDGGRRREDGRKENAGRKKATPIKSRDPHLAGGQKDSQDLANTRFTSVHISSHWSASVHTCAHFVSTRNTQQGGRRSSFTQEVTQTTAGESIRPRATELLTQDTGTKVPNKKMEGNR